MNMINISLVALLLGLILVLGIVIIENHSLDWAAEVLR